MNEDIDLPVEEAAGSEHYLIDANGLTTSDEDFFRIDSKTWIFECPVNHRYENGEGKHTDGRLYIYRKIANGELIDLVKADTCYIPAPTYKDFREKQTGMKWEYLLKSYEK